MSLSRNSPGGKKIEAQILLSGEVSELGIEIIMKSVERLVRGNRVFLS